MRLVISSIVLTALAANPCFAKSSHAQHGAHASTVNSGASAKGASANGPSGVNPAPSKVDVPIDSGQAVAPPVLPPRGVTRQQIRIGNPSVKTANPGNSARSRASAMMITAPTARNAIGQPIVSTKNFPSAQRVVPSPQKPVVVSPPIIHSWPAAPPVSSGAAHLNLANAANRGSVNGATVIRPATGASVIGGPAQAHYGINGTVVQNRR